MTEHPTTHRRTVIVTTVGVLLRRLRPYLLGRCLVAPWLEAYRLGLRYSTSLKNPTRDDRREPVRAGVGGRRLRRAHPQRLGLDVCRGGARLRSWRCIARDGRARRRRRSLHRT